MDQFVQMLSSFLRPRQETKSIAFSNYQASEVEALEDTDFQTFRNEIVKLLTASKAEQRKGAISPSKNSISNSIRGQCNFYICATDFSPSTATSISCKEIHLNHPRDSDASKSVNQPAQQRQVATKEQHPPREQPTSLIVFDNQQARPSRLLTFTLTLRKHHQLPLLQAKKINTTCKAFQAFFTPRSRFHHTTHNNKLPLFQPPPHSKSISRNQPSLSLLCSKLILNSSSCRTTTLVYNQSFSIPLLSSIKRSFLGPPESSKNN